MGSLMSRAILLQLGLLLLGSTATLGGCKLVDQRMFVADADKPPKPKLPPALPPPPSSALVVIAFPSVEDWQGTVGAAVGLARSRKPDVLFTVEAAVPRRGTPGEQTDALANAVEDARAVATTIVADGADRSQVELTGATDPLVKREEVRIYVR